MLDISDDIPYEIPNSWQWCRLGSIILLQSGQDLTPDRYSDKPTGVPYITGASNFIKGELVINRWTTSPTSISHDGDLLITCKGTVGTMAYNNTGNDHTYCKTDNVYTFSMCEHSIYRKISGIQHIFIRKGSS